MKLRLTPRASEQLLSAYDYLQAVNASAATTQIEWIFDAIDLLARYPHAGRKGRIAGTQEMVVPRTPFIVAYRLEQQELQILAVLHSSQRWPESF